MGTVSLWKSEEVHECGWHVPFIFSLNVPDILSQRQRALSLFISWLSPRSFSLSTSFLYLWHLPPCSSPHMSEPPRAWWTAWEWEEASVSESSKASPLSVEWKSTGGIILAFSMPTENRQEERRSKEWARQQTEAEKTILPYNASTLVLLSTHFRIVHGNRCNKSTCIPSVKSDWLRWSKYDKSQMVISHFFSRSVQPVSLASQHIPLSCQGLPNGHILLLSVCNLTKCLKIYQALFLC